MRIPPKIFIGNMYNFYSERNSGLREWKALLDNDRESILYGENFCAETFRIFCSLNKRVPNVRKGSDFQLKKYLSLLLLNSRNFFVPFLPFRGRKIFCFHHMEYPVHSELISFHMKMIAKLSGHTPELNLNEGNKSQHGFRFIFPFSPPIHPPVTLIKRQIMGKNNKRHCYGLFMYVILLVPTCLPAINNANICFQLQNELLFPR